ncbi:MAG: DUF4974 domain-containing protein [Bacteroidales bacterium]|jgi:ferric-dicitrate binding protein FerR (iron transport regulator)|nr:DUF4974 domain-containing protein [Bacteroidales bacterium]
MDKQIISYFEGKLNYSEQNELFQKIDSDDELRKDFISTQNIIGIVSLTERNEDEETEQQQYSDFIKNVSKKKRRSIGISILKYAATVALLVSLSAVTIYYFMFHRQHEVASNVIFVPDGQRAMVTLHDGTVVWLNSLSTLTYPSHFAGGIREVILEGEGFFNIAKDPGHPFYVSTKDIKVKALGTVFNIVSYPVSENKAQVTLLEGSVLVYKEDNIKEAVVLKPMENLYIDNNDKMTVLYDEDSEQLSLWREGIYYFNNNSFGEIIDKLQTYFGVKIIVEKEELLSNRFTGKFRQTDGIDYILKVLQKIKPFTVEKDAENNLIIF